MSGHDQSLGTPLARRFFHLPPVAFPQGSGNVAAALWESLTVSVRDTTGDEPEAGADASALLFEDARSALRVVLECMHGLQPDRDQVIIPAYTCHSVPDSVAAAGLGVVLCDIRPESLDFDYDELARLAGPRTLAIIAGHLFRSPVDYPRLAGVAVNSGAFVVDDAAQGGDSGDLETVSVDARIHSFGRGKPVSTGGGGGLQIKGEALRSRVSQAHGQLPVVGLMPVLKTVLAVTATDIMTRPWLYWIPAGIPLLGLGASHVEVPASPRAGSRFMGALLPRARARARGLDRIRREHARHYAAAFSGSPQPGVHRHRDYAPQRFPVFAPVPIADLPMGQLGRLGVSRMYPLSLDEPGQSGQSGQSGQFGQFGQFGQCGDTRDAGATGQDRAKVGARWVARHLLTLPTHHHLRVRERQAIIQLLMRPQS